MSRPRLQSVMRAGGERAASLNLPHAALAQVVARALPHRFDPDAARDLEATLELRLRGARPGVMTVLTLQVNGGELTVTPGPAPGAGAVVELGAEDVIRLASGAVGWPELIAGGRMTLSGDPFLALRFPALFHLPAAG